VSSRKRLYRSRTNRAIWGVCGGLGDYFDVDPAFLRVAFVLLAFANGVGLIAYIVLAIATQKEPETPSAAGTPPTQVMRENVQAAGQTPNTGTAPQPSASVGGESGLAQTPTTESADRIPYVVGGGLIVLGAVFLMGELGLFSWLRWGRLWPLALIAAGLAVIFSRVRR